MAVLKPLLPADAVVCTVGAGSIGQAVKDLGLEHHAVVTFKDVHAIGAWHIQNVNSYHGRFRGRMRRFHDLATAAAKAALGALPSAAPTPAGPRVLQWSSAALPLVEVLRVPLGTRTPVGYDSGLAGNYIPNQSGLLASQLATELFNAGRSRDQQPARAYAREVLEQLLIDLSWSPSRLTRDNKSLLDTKEHRICRGARRRR